MQMIKPEFNLVLFSIYLVFGYCWLTFDFGDGLLSIVNLAKLITIFALFCVYLRIMRIRRAQSDESILKYRGWYVPFYIPD